MHFAADDFGNRRKYHTTAAAADANIGSLLLNEESKEHLSEGAGGSHEASSDSS